MDIQTRIKSLLRRRLKKPLTVVYGTLHYPTRPRELAMNYALSCQTCRGGVEFHLQNLRAIYSLNSLVVGPFSSCEFCDCPADVFFYFSRTAEGIPTITTTDQRLAFQEAVQLALTEIKAS